MANRILQIKSPVRNDTDIISQQFHTYTPFVSSFNNNDEIRMVIQSQDMTVLPSESYLFMEFTIAKKDKTRFEAREAVFSLIDVNIRVSYLY